MTIKDLKTKINNLDDSSTIAMQRPDGTQMKVTRVSQQGSQFTLYVE